MIDPRRPLVVMYHSIWPDGQPVPAGIRPMLVSEFEAQLDWLGERYDLVSPGLFIDRLDEVSDRPPCLLTFDDGTRDHATVATPILARRGLGGVFFIVSDAARGITMPTTHLAHWMLGQDESFVWDSLQAFATEHGDDTLLGDPREAARIYHYEPERRGRIKYALNMAMPPAVARSFALGILGGAGIDQTSLASHTFANAADLRAMHAAGMTLGVHGRSHVSLQQLGPRIADEIDDCARFLAEITGAPPTWWACPFGGSGASADAHAAMRAALERAGIRAAVSTEASSVPSGCDPLAIPRIDCANLHPRR